MDALQFLYTLVFIILPILISTWIIYHLLFKKKEIGFILAGLASGAIFALLSCLFSIIAFIYAGFLLEVLLIGLIALPIGLLSGPFYGVIYKVFSKNKILRILISVSALFLFLTLLLFLNVIRHRPPPEFAYPIVTIVLQTIHYVIITTAAISIIFEFIRIKKAIMPETDKKAAKLL